MVSGEYWGMPTGVRFASDRPHADEAVGNEFDKLQLPSGYGFGLYQLVTAQGTPRLALLSARDLVFWGPRDALPEV